MCLFYNLFSYFSPEYRKNINLIGLELLYVKVSILK